VTFLCMQVSFVNITQL